jgi:MoaA/NifB/PqqE/SkfB family radical SAM enzyme
MDTGLKFIFACRLFFAGKLSIRKVFNLLRVKVHYHLKLNRASSYPALLVVEPTNNCQLRCTKCRTLDNNIFDYAFDSQPGAIPIGRIEKSVFEKAVDTYHKHLMIAVLYMQGEPFLSKDLCEMVKYCTDKNLATIVGTNGMLCGKENAEKIVESGMDILKIAVSGFRQNTYERYHKLGDIELIKNNLSDLSKAKKRHGSKLIVHVEYIIFDYNHDEFHKFKEYCDNLDVICTRREDNWTYAGENEAVEGKTAEEKEAVWYSDRLCDWLWGVLALNHDGTIIPCCVFSKSSEPKILGRITPESTTQDIDKIWNNSNFLDFRKSHIEGGRKGDPVCSTCQLEGLGIQSAARESRR